MNLARNPQPRVAVVGAGLAGVSVALELALHGCRVTLIDQDVRPMNRASRRNEGKIHLGFVYANEPNRRTARLMVDGAVVFAPLVRRWLGMCPEASTPFQYLIHRDSVVKPDAFHAHCEAVEEYFGAALRASPDRDYLGLRPERLWRPATESEIMIHKAGGEIVHAVRTEERALDTDHLADLLAARVCADENIDFVGGVRVRGFDRGPSGTRICAERDGVPWEFQADILVNCTWERRCALDQTLGIAPPRDILHRLKYRVIAQVPDTWRGAASMTMVVGPYGDIVVRPDGTAFLSWYPVGRMGWTNAVEPPREWDAPSSGNADPSTARQMACGILAALDRYYPGIGAARVLQVDAGPIVATGRSDVDDRKSGLHHRSEVGFQDYGNVFTLDPGKLTTAPLFGARLAHRIACLIGKAPGRTAGAVALPEVAHV